MNSPTQIPYRDLIKQNWIHSIADLAGMEPQWGTIEGILDLYDEPDRHYHNIDHIGRMLVVFKSARPKCTMPNEVTLAIIFHDAIYNPRAKDNEEKSAELAIQTLAAFGVPRACLDLIEDLILCTKHHIPTAHPASTLMIDTDLSILGSLDEEYDIYSRAIRTEYSFVSDGDYRVGRTNVLNSFLRRDSIYLLPWFRERIEEQARRNIVLEIAKLGG
jgi:predicted metal-dependent HD superfamily phosphohydrolase